MIYTSSYSLASKYLSPINTVFIRISTSMPAWWNKPYEAFPAVYPGWDLVNGIKEGRLTEEEYTRAYLYKLSYVDLESIKNKVREWELQGKDVCFMCYCGVGKFCHRHLLLKAMGLNYVEFKGY